MTQSAELAVDLRGIGKRFANVAAVQGLDLAIERGCLCGLLGPNGAGKSTTIRMIMSIIKPDVGTVSVLGADALAMKDRIGYLPEERGLYRKMRVLEFLVFLGRLKGMPSKGLSHRIRRWLERLELPGVERARCSELSKGMQQKVQFLAAVVNDPELIVLDEPFSGLDPVNARVVTSVVSELHEAGRTIVFSTHQMHQAEQLCDRVILINRGEKILDETMAEIQAQFDPRTIIAETMDPSVDLSTLAGCDGIESVEREGTAGHWLLRLDSQCHAQAAMQAALRTTSLRLVSLRRTSLDEVFVTLVTQHGGHARTEVR